MEHVKQTLRRLLKETLTTAQMLPVAKRRQAVHQGLRTIQEYCASVGKTFIVCELKITCAQYELGGCRQQSATLFRGPNEDASVAICVTEQGSLLHRNGSPWKIYCDAGDINPVQPAVLAAVGAR